MLFFPVLHVSYFLSRSVVIISNRLENAQECYEIQVILSFYLCELSLSYPKALNALLITVDKSYGLKNVC